MRPIGLIRPIIPPSTYPLIQQSLNPMTTKPPISREDLLTLLERFSLCPAAFDALRSDTFEKHVAARSLEELERFYTTLLNPALSYAKIQPLCPRWIGGRQNGRPPSLQTLSDIKRRILAEHTVNDLGQMEKLLTSLRHRSSTLSKEFQTEMFNAIVALLGEELLTAKLDGQPIMENLPVVDRLLKVAALRLREQQGEARLKLQERREERQATNPPPNRSHSEDQCSAENEEDPSESSMTESEKTDALIERVYGIKLHEPFEKYPPFQPPQVN